MYLRSPVPRRHREQAGENHLNIVRCQKFEGVPPEPSREDVCSMLEESLRQHNTHDMLMAGLITCLLPEEVSGFKYSNAAVPEAVAEPEAPINIEDEDSDGFLVIDDDDDDDDGAEDNTENRIVEAMER
eukprot:PhM_4_TR14212/c3_g7_i6/m.101582